MGKLLKTEMVRLSTKTTRSAFRPLKQEVAALKRTVSSQRKTIQQLERAVDRLLDESDRRREASVQATEEEVRAARVTPGWILRLRDKLGLTREEFASLAGVSANSIYLWESGRTRPRASAKAALVELKKLGVREARKRLEEAD
jgi:DNA-binding transcriptional regulator YiaG